MKNIATLVLVAAVLAASVSLADYSAPLEDDYKTMALWNMDELKTLSDGKVICYDQDTNFSRENRHIEFFNGPDVSTDRGGSLVVGQSGFGNAVSFNGTTEFARSFQKIPVTDGFEIEFWVKLDSTKTDLNWIAEVPGVWRIYAEQNQTRINMYVKDANDAWSERLRLAISPDSWQHVTAGFENGTAYMSVDGTTQSTSVTLPTQTMYMSGQSEYVWLGSFGTSDRFLKGQLDDVRLSDPAAQMPEPPAWESVYEDTVRGTYALYHFEEIVNSKILDDNSSGGRDSLDLNVRGNPQIGTDGTYPADNSQFANCVTLDGMLDYFDAPINPNIDSSNLKVEAWVNLDPDWYTISNSLMPIVWYGDMFRIHFRGQDGTLSGRRITVAVWDGNGTFTDYFLNQTCNALVDGWNYIAFEFNQGEGKLYINDVVVKTATLPTTSLNPAATGTMFVGGTSTTGRRLWGSIDEFRISNLEMPEPQCGDFGYLEADLNQDCIVDILDLKLFVADWLRCTADEPGCESAF